MQTRIYFHPDVGTVDYNIDRRELEVTSGDVTIVFPIGPLGLLEVIENLAGVATTCAKLDTWGGAKP